MGTIRKLWRKLRKWFDKRGKKLVKEAKEIIKDAFADMKIPVSDLFDDSKRDAIAEELIARIKALKGDLKDWVIETALESLWEEVNSGFIAGRKT